MKISQTNARIAQRQSGIATVAIAFLLILFMGLAILGASSLTTGVALDSSIDHDRVSALFMAETGIEKASYRFNSGTGCANLSETTATTMTSATGATLGTVQVTSFTTDFSGSAISNTVTTCRVRARATTASGQVTRTIEAMIGLVSGNGTKGNRTFCCPFSSGTNNALVVALNWNDTGGGYAATMTSGGSSMTPATSQITRTSTGGTTYSSQLFYQVNPTGTSTCSSTANDNVFVSFNGNNSNLNGINFQCYLLSGVTSSTLDTLTGTSTTSGNGTSISATFSTSSTTGNRWIVDNLSYSHNGSYSAASSSACSGHNSNDTKFNGQGNDGSGSICGTVAASTSVTLSYTKNGQAVDYAYEAAAFIATGSASILIPSNYKTLDTVSNSTNAMSQWREITAPPL